MQEMTFRTMLAVMEEVFGRTLFWALVAIAVLITLTYLYVLIRDRAISWNKFLLAQLSMPVGAVGAVWVVMALTRSRLSDMGGAVDVIVLAGIAAIGAVGMAVLVYTAQSLIRGAPSEHADTDAR